MEVVRGQRFGLICFGSRLEVVLPLESKILVQAGQKVRAGETPIGYL
jgi:phosphatidylserine decarboxylase